ncbi:unnamed protein product, partial [Cladocopium goreaui]
GFCLGGRALLIIHMDVPWYHPKMPAPSKGLEYLRKKNVTWAVEQPSSSLLPLYKPIKAGFGV